MYPRRFMMDITNATQAACIALRSSTSAPPTPARPFWYGRDVSLILKKADQEPALRAAVGTYIKDMSAAWQPAEDLMERLVRPPSFGWLYLPALLDAPSLPASTSHAAL